MADVNVIGLGTGRCGSKSLAHLLDMQGRSYVTHERFRWRVPWERRKGEMMADLVIADCEMREEYALAGDVGFYWYPYIGYYLAHLPDIRFIVMKRDQESVVESYLRITPERNHWQHFEKPHPEWHHDRWDHCYPKYEGTKREAVEEYWKRYYIGCEEFEQVFPDKFRVFPTDTLNSREGQRRIFDFLSIPSDCRVYEVGIRRNRTS